MILKKKSRNTFVQCLGCGSIMNTMTLWPNPPSVNVAILSFDKVWLGLTLSYLRFDIICKLWSHSVVNMADDQWKKSTKWRKVNIIYFCLLVFSLDSNKFDIAFLPRFILRKYFFSDSSNFLLFSSSVNQFSLYHLIPYSNKRYFQLYSKEHVHVSIMII